MTANIHPKTGIRYGVIQGNSVPELLDEIMMQGNNDSYDLWKQEQIKTIVAALVECGANENRSDSRLQSIAEDALDACDIEYESEEDHYSHTETTPEGDIKYHASCLGGAYLIYVLESPWIIGCRQCSPCVPNGGDLDHPNEFLDLGGMAYCIKPEDAKEIEAFTEKAVTPVLISTVNALEHQ